MKTLKRIGLAGVFLFLLFLPCQVYAWDMNDLDIVETNGETETRITCVLQPRSYTSAEEMIQEIGDFTRQIMLGRPEKETVRFEFPLTVQLTEEEYNGIKGNQDGFNQKIDQWICREETGCPDAGQMLVEEYDCIGNRGWYGGLPSYQDGKIEGTYYFVVNRNTSNEDYALFQQKAQELLDGLNLDGMSEDEKVLAIAYKVNTLVKYNFNGSESGYKNSAVATLFAEKGNCDNYANLFYYLGNLAGIDTLYDWGASKASGHAWNLVKLDGLYYYIDSQGFYRPEEDGSYRYENLYGTHDCPNVSKTDIAENYPVSEGNWRKYHTACQGNHDMVYEGCNYYCRLYEWYICQNCQYETKVYTGEENHTWNEGEVLQEADCTHEEITKYSCTRNACIAAGMYATKEEVTSPALGHDYSEPVEVAATCTKPAYRVQTCSRCQDEIREELEQKALGHDYQAVETEPTCTEDGCVTYTCSRCSDTYTEPSGKKATGHEYEETVTKEPDCNHSGKANYVCKHCGDTYDGILPSTGHDFVFEEIPATCTKNSYTKKTCQRCQVSYTIDHEETALGHTWDEGKVTKEPDCTNSGIRLYTCKTCQATREEKINAKGHVPETRNKEPTCTEVGRKGDVYCSVCDEILEYGESIETLPHDYDEGVVTKEPAYGEDGIREYTCKVCNYKIQRVIKFHEHSGYEKTITKKATCLEEGTEHYQCLYCDFSFDIAIPKTTHGKTVVKGKKDPTCTEDGYTGDKVCETCETVIEGGKILPAKGHTYVNYVSKQATCKEEGERTYFCSTCSHKTTEPIPKTENHRWEAGVITKDPTCKEEGLRVYTCYVCKKEKEEVLPVTNDHHWEKGELIKEATCKEAGEQEYHCSVCSIEKTESIPRKEHTYGAWKNLTSATVLKKATRNHKCTECGQVDIEEYGSLVRPILSANASSLKLKTKQSTTKFFVSFAAGDSVKSWTSSNPKIVSVSGSSNGSCKLKAGSKTGKAKLTVTLTSGLSKTITVSVQKKAVATTSIKGIPKKLTLKKGQSFQLKPAVAPITTVEKVKYKSSKKGVAKVSSKGVIKAVKKGTAKITVQAGKKKVTCTVVVK